MLKIHDITKSYSGRKVLSGISLSLPKGAKVALVGPNGVGKSTLLRILAGEEDADSGKIEGRPLCVGYLPQELQINDLELTVGEYIDRIVGKLTIESHIRDLEGQLSDPQKALKYDDLQDAYSHLVGHDYEYRVDSVLAGMGLNANFRARKIRSLSGGQKTKIAMAGILLKRPDFFLLDEPTNNLDLKAILWLEEFLSESPAACLIVSHDRTFVDSIITKVVEIDWNERNLTEFSGTYSDYIQHRMREMQKRSEQYQRQQDEILRLTQSVRQKLNWSQVASRQTTRDNDKYVRGFRRDRSAKTASQAKSIGKKVEQMNKVDPEQKREPLTIPLAAQLQSGKQPIVLKSVVAGYGSDFQIGPVDLVINFGERVGILGRNGVGKTTLLKVISGQIVPISGSVTIGAALVVGNMMQEHENIPRDISLECFLRSATQRVDKAETRHLLSQFHFLPEEDSDRLLGELSPGERSRLVLAKFAAESANVLILDEPTNHLDVDALGALEKVLSSYTGTVIFVSHDRSFLEHVNSTRLYELHKGALKEVYDYKTFMESVE